jgi:hypothetical protein
MSASAARPAALRVQVDIDTLVLRGVPRRQAPLVVAALEARLGELAAGAEPDELRGTVPADHPRRAAPTARPAGPGPTALGRAVAESVWAGVRGVDQRGGRP